MVTLSPSSGMDPPKDLPNSTAVAKEDAHAKFIIGCSEEDFDDAPEEDEQWHVVPPDGGWGWVVVAASFMCNAIVDGIIFTSGMLFPKLRETFGASNQEVAWISSLLGGFYLLVGPFVAAMANAFGFRIVCILGALIASAACGISYYATSIYYLYGSFGVLGGIGFGLIYVPAVIAAGFYFEKRRALATGIAVCGSGIGTFVMSPLNAYLLTSLGDRWRIIFLVYAGIILSCVFFGLAFRPLTASTGKRRKAGDDLDVSGTPLLMRIKRARDKDLANCPSALSMSSSYSKSPSQLILEEPTLVFNGDLKPPTSNIVARTLLERHGGGGGGINKRFSFPGLAAISGHEPILEESEVNHVDESETKSLNIAGETPNYEVPKQPTVDLLKTTSEHGNLQKGPESGTGRLLDDNKNETTVSQNNRRIFNKCPELGEPGKYPRIESAPSLNRHPRSSSVDYVRRPSRVALRTEISRPFYRDDIYYSGSLARLPQYQSSSTIDQYHASVTHLPPMEVLMDGSGKESCKCCPTSLSQILLRIFDFSLLSSITFIVLSISGFLALMSLFVPFNFVPSYAIDIGIDPADTSFIMSLIGICNTVGRIVAGWVSDHPQVDALFVNNVALVVGGGATIILPFISDLSLLYGYAILFGFSVAAFASLRSILLVELLGLEKLTNAFGLLLLFQGFAATFGSPIAGAFVDMTKEYKLSFYVFGGIFALSGILCVPLRKIKKWEDERTDRKLRKEKYGAE